MEEWQIVLRCGGFQTLVKRAFWVLGDNALKQATRICVFLQELCNMALLTAFNELNPEIEHEGLETVVRSYEGINVTDHDLYRFQVRIGLGLPG